MFAGSLEAAAVPGQVRTAAVAAATTLTSRARMNPPQGGFPAGAGSKRTPAGLRWAANAGRMETMAHRSFALRRHGTDVAELHALDALTCQADPAAGARLVAEASAPNLPTGNQTADPYPSNP